MTTLTEKLIAIIEKEKDINKMIESYHRLGEVIHEKVEKHRKELIEKANQLPKIQNGQAT